ncbi:MAG: ArsR/SmtB family transcription factor [Panacagrimonas sp.]
MDSKSAVSRLASLAQESRLAVFRLLVRQGPEGLAAGEIAARLGIPPATLSFHLKELSNAGLLAPRQEGRFIYYAPNFKVMNALIAYLTENCCAESAGAPGTSCSEPATCCESGERGES